MRSTDFTKPQNKKRLSLLEQADKKAGSPNVKPVSGAAQADTDHTSVAKPGSTVYGTANAGLGVGRLTQAQIQEAYLAGKLPAGFPIDQWEGLNTKQQLYHMQRSGLNAQDQWALLNTGSSLKDLVKISNESIKDMLTTSIRWKTLKVLL